MLNQETLNKLHELKLSNMAEDVRNQSLDPAFESLAFEERLALLIDLEWARKKNQKIKTLTAKAKFCLPNACVEDIEYLPSRKIDKASMVKFSSGLYLEEHRNIIITGPTGSGKSYVACALGNSACRKGKKVRYVRLPDLLSELSDSRIEGNFKKVMDAYKKVELLILDEWLFMDVTQSEARDLLELVEYRYNQKSIIFCSQFLPGGWHKKLGEGTLGEAILDRIIHNSYKLNLEAKESMRKLQGIQE